MELVLDIFLKAFSPGPNHHLHLEDISLGDTGGDQLLQHLEHQVDSSYTQETNLLLIQSEASGEVRDPRSQQELGHKVCPAGDCLPLQVPRRETIKLVSPPPGGGLTIR